MIETDDDLNHSLLTQSVTRDGKTVCIEIYEDGEGGWLLEVVDEYGNSNCWESSFATDQEALDEALKTIDEEGIESLIGLPAELQKGMFDTQLSEAELDELDDFLAGEAIQDTSMDVATLDGFLTAIAIGPRFVSPSEWLPWVWDMDDGEAEAQFNNEAQASRIISFIMRHYNAVTHAFSTDATSFEPIFWRGDQWGAAEWSEGFIMGFRFNDDAWSQLAIKHPTWFAPFLRLGNEDVAEIDMTNGKAENLVNEIEPSLLKIHAYWQENSEFQTAGQASDDLSTSSRREFEQVLVGGPKVGRNEPCPCGSGLKYKKCCGANGKLSAPTVH